MASLLAKLLGNKERKRNMATDMTKGIASLEKLLNYYGLEYSMTGAKYPHNITSMEILGVPFTTSAWFIDDFMELVDYLTFLIEDEGMTLKQLKNKLSKYDLSNTEITCEYVKDSYRNTHMSLAELLMKATNDIKIAQDKFESVFDKRATHEFKSTESAFLYNGYYITPCILRSIIELAWNDCEKQSQKEYLQKFYNGQKQNVQTIATDCLADMFNNNDISRLIMIDNFRIKDNERV